MENNVSNRCYSRNDMIHMRDLPKSRTRPIDLSDEFNNEDGLFSPDKWLQHRWQCEGVESRPTGSGLSRKKTSSRAEEVAAQDLETVVLSPQRRGFFSGCRAPSPKTTDDEKATKARWRQNLNNGGGVDFKPFFQKNVEPTRGRPGNNSSVWRNNTNDQRPWNNDKSSRNNRNNNNFDEKQERLPEWVVEGPSSMTDIIELKGFDDDIRDKKKRRRNRDSASKSGSHSTTANSTGQVSAVAVESDAGRERNSHSNSTQSSRPNSRLAAAAGNLPPLGVSADAFDNVAAKSGNALESVFAMGGETCSNMIGGDGQPVVNLTVGISLPNSDAEFAALLGILDVDPTTVQNNALAVQANQPSSSRFSRFFCKNSSTSSAAEQRPLFDNFVLPPSKSPHPSGGLHNGPSVLELAKTGGVFNRTGSGSGGCVSKMPDNAPMALKELFSSMPPRPHTPVTPRDFKESMTVEELERDLAKFHYAPPRSPMMAPPLMNPPVPPFHNAPFPDAAAASAAKLAAMQALAPPNEQFLAAFHQHMQQHFQRMAASGGGIGGQETSGPETAGMPFAAASLAAEQRPLFDNFVVPPSKSPHPSGVPHNGSSMLELAKTGGVFNRSGSGGGGCVPNMPDNAPMALKQLFSSMPPRPHTPRDFKESMTVEELERDLAKFHYAPPHSPMMAPPLMNPPLPPFHNTPFPDAAAKLAAMQAIAPPNEQFLAAFHQHMQQHFQRMAASGGGIGGQETLGPETAGMPFAATTKFPFVGRQPPQPQYDARSPGGAFSPFMPTSVLRQLSTLPTNPAFAADQQQLNMAIMRGDQAAAQAIRARILSHVQTLTGLNSGGGGLNPYQE